MCYFYAKYVYVNACENSVSTFFKNVSIVDIHITLVVFILHVQYSDLAFLYFIIQCDHSTNSNNQLL